MPDASEGFDNVWLKKQNRNSNGLSKNGKKKDLCNVQIWLQEHDTAGLTKAIEGHRVTVKRTFYKV